MLTYGSLFAGAGGIDMGLESAGMRCIWQVECDPTANTVRRRHWPDVEHIRDVAGLSRRPTRHGHWLDRYERPDVICGGFPCQDVSVAGKRAGLVGNRSGLWWQMLRIITGMRPSYVVWENVPGLLSSDGGRDFERVVNSLVERGYRGAWRVLDAQHFGVPQRRRRVFGVFASGHLGAERCAQILALTQGVCGHPSPRGQAGEGVAFTLAASVGRSREGNRIGNAWNTNYVAPRVPTCLTRREGKGVDSDATNTLVAFSSKDSGADSGKLGPTLRAMGHSKSHANAGGQVAVAYRVHGEHSTAMTGNGVANVADPVDVARCLDSGGGYATNQGGNVIQQPASGVRRLTPRECERLMGWEEWELNYEVEICFESQKNPAPADGQSPKLPKRASSAEKSKSREPAGRAESCTSASSPSSDSPAQCRVQLFCGEERTTLTDSNGKVLWSVNSVGPESESESREKAAAFARHCAGVGLIADQATRSGKAEFHPSERYSIRRVNGRLFVRMSGNGTTQPASDAKSGSFTTGEQSTKSTTLHPSLSSACVSNFLTSCSFVAHAMTGFIPVPTHCGSSLLIDVTLKYCHTRYGHDGREIADGPRYKLCGNGVVKNVAEWIGRRLIEVDAGGPK